MRRLLTIIAMLAALCTTQAQTPADSLSRRAQFVWGADFGSSIDLSAHDMSSFDFNAAFGLRWRWLSMAGVGAGVNVMVSNSCRTYPVYAIVRTGFTERRQLMFLDLRGGVALNYLPHNRQQTGAYCSAGVGFNLAGGKKFQSYIVAGYTFISRKGINDETGYQPYDNLDYACIRLGVEF